MAVQYKDYYKTLGVARDASQEEIKRAFRKLARESHPDHAKDSPGAEERFKEVNEAYEALRDPERRRKYDQFGSSFQGGQGAGGAPGFEEFRWEGGGPTGGGFSFGGSGFSDFFESLFGQGFGGGFPQGASGGRSRSPFAREGRDYEAPLLVSLEEANSGSVREITLRAPGGEPETYRVKVPAGVRDGQRIRLKGRGGSGAGGGAPGNLYLIVKYENHPDLAVDEANLVHEAEIAPWDAALGGSTQAPTLKGRISVKIPAGAKDGARLRVKGLGLMKADGGRGDLLIALRIRMPKAATPEQRDLWLKLKESYREG